ncbi:MAG: pantetheine-phosphate adenylyltransferase [Bacteroidia bacterium]|nr:pantetheine-phosphate adenylyltransferase [Bacteroidia bacterium]MCX7651862.1 pantetheine-phosphate adenylyltransferase [Bacteroidia bacterium]MDW8415988.1 pantetheine-phosphate adenylyltransferase [Bacteroidia bacterium]
MKRALFPGSFDPITNGHIEIIRRGLTLFDEIVVGIGLNTSKQPMFPPAQRLKWIQEVFQNEPRVQVTTYTGLTVRFAREIQARFILRGLRSAPDYEYERNIDLLNKYLDESIETFYLLSSPETSFVSSTLVREVIKFHGHLEGLLPPHIIADIYATYPESRPVGSK